VKNSEKKFKTGIKTGKRALAFCVFWAAFLN
jgi:hypothetical protein